MIFDLQKASMWKRISAFLFDGILLVTLVVGIAALLSMLLGFDTYNQTLSDCYTKYEEQYGIVFDITQDEYDKLTDAQRANYEAAYNALSSDMEAIYAYNMILNLTLVIVSISILLGFVVLEFAIPLFLGNGQTLGKKIFSVALMRTGGIRINAVCLFIRTVLGKYTLETMIPVLILIMLYFGSIGLAGTFILVLIIFIQLVLLAVTRTNSVIHDLLADTVAVDISSQMIFKDQEALLQYQKKIAAEKAERQPY